MDQKKIPIIESLSVSLLLISIDMICASPLMALWVGLDLSRYMFGGGLGLLFLVSAFARFK
jgi:hypothetical protein